MDKETVIKCYKAALNCTGLGAELDKLYNYYPGYDYYRMAFYLSLGTKPEVVVELGTQYARCAAHFAAGRITTKVVTIDHEDCMKNNLFLDYPNIYPYQGGSCDPSMLSKVEDKSVDILFCDTQHQTDWVLYEIDHWMPKLKPGALILIDDLREMPDLMIKLPFKTKGTLVGIHTGPVTVPENIIDIGFGYAIVD